MTFCLATILSIALLLGNAVTLRAYWCNPRVAFTAVLSSPTGTSTDIVTLLPFDQATTLLPGTNFDLNTGKFTCNVPGTYVFMFSARKGTPEVWVFLRKNGDVIVSSHSNDQGGEEEQVSGSAVLQLQQGDEVYLTLLGKAIGGGYHGTSFIGFLLYHD